MLDNENEEVMQELRHYCSRSAFTALIPEISDDLNAQIIEGTDALYKAIGKFLIKISVVIFVLAIIVPTLFLVKNLITDGTAGEIISLYRYVFYGIPPLIFGFILLADSPKKQTDTRIDTQLKIIQNNGELEKMLVDFKQSIPKYNDAFRLGNIYIFGRSPDKIIKLDTIKRISRVRDDKYSDSRITGSSFYIRTDLGFRQITLCHLNFIDPQNDTDWSELIQEMKMRHPTVKVTAALIEHKKYQSPED